VVGEPQERRLEVLAGPEVASGEVDAPAERAGPVGKGGNVHRVVALATQVPDLQRHDAGGSFREADVERLFEGPGPTFGPLDRGRPGRAQGGSVAPHVGRNSERR